ncbi:MAG: preprotein translocase subunit SecE [Eggerthellaceae bacterium]|nr:preprotein translocase subunit SecE [Eggerthellaceae bacterium]
MAKKSKTQRAKASARRAEKRDIAENVPESISEGLQDASAADTAKKSAAEPAKGGAALSKTEKKPVKKQPGRIATFFQGVRSELRRVTWPTRTDVIRWSGVVVGALLFFGVFVFVLDNIFPQLLVLIDSFNGTGA